jgi:MFS transporter, DHA2 family, methylenomycin A resistance protein
MRAGQACGRCAALLRQAAGWALTAEHGPRRAMLAGFTLTRAALLAMIAIGADTAYLSIALLFALAGFGQGLAIPASMAAALEIVPRQRSGVGSATVNAARQTGTVLGIAVLGTMIGKSLTSAATDLAGRLR